MFVTEDLCSVAGQCRYGCGRKKLTSLVLGEEQKRALRSATILRESSIADR